MPPAEHARRLAECVELLELAPFLATPVRQLSLGQRMRGEVTAALLSPELLVLDEPTVGLDLISKEARHRRADTDQDTRRHQVAFERGNRGRGSAW